MAKTNAKFREVDINTAILYGLKDGEYTVREIGRVDVLAVRLPAELRKRSTVALTAYIGESIEYDAFPRETGFYPVRKGGKSSLGFYHDGRIELISRSYASEVRISGGVIDLDEEHYRKEVLKHLQHLEREMRKLRKDKEAKAPTSGIDEEVERLVKGSPALDTAFAEMKAASLK